MPGFKFSIKGTAEMRKALAAIKKNYPKKLKRSLVTWAEGVMTDSKEHYVPVDTGTLRASGRVTPDKGESIGVTLSYGGAASDYALAVHENHKTKSKYLETPLMAAASTAAKDIADGAQFDEDDKK